MLLETELKNNNFKVFKLNKDYNKEDLLEFTEFLKDYSDKVIPFFRTLEGKHGDYLMVLGNCSCESYDIWLDDKYGEKDKYFIIIEVINNTIIECLNEKEFNEYFKIL